MSLEKDLEQFYGTQNWYRLNLTPILCTDGVNYFAKKGNACWAVDDMCLNCMDFFKKKEYFISIEIKSDGEKATITYEDGNYNKLKEDKYNVTDLEKGTYKFFCTDNVLLLRSEY